MKNPTSELKDHENASCNNALQQFFRGSRPLFTRADALG